MRLLFLGDVVGRSGRNAIQDRLSDLRERLKADFVVVDENPLENLHVLLGTGADKLNDETGEGERVVQRPLRELGARLEAENLHVIESSVCDGALQLLASRSLDRVVVLGANGTMGYGSAALFTTAGCHVTFLARTKAKAGA